MAEIERRDQHLLRSAAAHGRAATQRRSDSDAPQLDYEILRKHSDAIGCFALCIHARCRRARRCMADASCRNTCKRRCMPREYW